MHNFLLVHVVEGQKHLLQDKRSLILAEMIYFNDSIKELASSEKFGHNKVLCTIIQQLYDTHYVLVIDFLEHCELAHHEAAQCLTS